MEALADLHQALDQAPEDRSSLLRRAETYVAMKRWQDALRDLGTLLELDPTDQEALYRRMEVLRVAGKLEEAVVAADEAVGSLPDSAAMLHGRAAVHHARGDTDAKRRDLQSAVRLARAAADAHPGNLRRRLELLAYLVALDEVSEVRAVYDSIHERITDNDLDLLRNRLEEQAGSFGETAAHKALLDRLRA